MSNSDWSNDVLKFRERMLALAAQVGQASGEKGYDTLARARAFGDFTLGQKVSTTVLPDWQFAGFTFGPKKTDAA